MKTKKSTADNEMKERVVMKKADDAFPRIRFYSSKKLFWICSK